MTRSRPTVSLATYSWSQFSFAAKRREKEAWDQVPFIVDAVLFPSQLCMEFGKNRAAVIYCCHAFPGLDMSGYPDSIDGARNFFSRPTNMDWVLELVVVRFYYKAAR